jgi:hypothetical protein
VMVIRLIIDFGEFVKVVLKRGVGIGLCGEGRVIGAAWFCGPCVCLGVFLLCSGGCLCQGLQGAVIVYSWYSRLVSGW